jgi:hypothetical protein
MSGQSLSESDLEAIWEWPLPLAQLDRQPDPADLTTVNGSRSHLCLYGRCLADVGLIRWTAWVKCACIRVFCAVDDGRSRPPLRRCHLTVPCSIGANKDTFSKLGAYSVALFVLSLGPFFAIARTPFGGEARLLITLRAARRFTNVYSFPSHRVIICRSTSLDAQREGHHRVSGAAARASPPDMPIPNHAYAPTQRHAHLQRGCRRRHRQPRHCGVRLQRLPRGSGPGGRRRPAATARTAGGQPREGQAGLKWRSLAQSY